MPRYVNVEKTYFDRLVRDSLLLKHLRAAGVEKWEGYADAYELAGVADEENKTESDAKGPEL